MWRTQGPASVLMPPLIVMIAGLMVAILPGEAWIGLMVWTLLSFPIGVLVGHCVLSETDRLEVVRASRIRRNH